MQNDLNLNGERENFFYKNKILAKKKKVQKKEANRKKRELFVDLSFRNCSHS